MDPNVLRLAMGAAGAGGEDNYLYSWGSNGSGRLGLNVSVLNYYSSPKQVGLLKDWGSISGSQGGAFWSAIKTDNTLWGCGYNLAGALGDGTNTTRSSPVQIGSLSNWSNVSAGGNFNVAVKTNGTMWSWGYNGTYGQLGLGNTTSYSSPKQIGSLTNWSQVKSASVHSLAIKTDGTLWAWGSNYFGQLGIGTSGPYAHKSSPVQVGALTTWSKIAAGGSFSLGITTDGKLWAWGFNGNGRLGTGNTTNRSSPTQIGSLTTWSNVFAGNGSCFAIKTDGTLWAWGVNNTNQLGDGTATAKSSPVQIGALTNWSLISSSNSHTIAIKTDNTLWAWGLNSSGELGLGDTTQRSSPVQVGALTNWKTCGTCQGASFAITK
jgi:alpha-tubulin suppressor-like RCC1 family protein